MNARKSMLFSNGSALIKKDSNSFDLTMGIFYGAEICELVRIFILNGLYAMCGKGNIDLYNDDVIAVFKNTRGP